MSILRQVLHGLRKRRVDPETLRDVRAFSPGAARLASEIAAARRDLAAAHAAYTSSVSSPDMAVSLETASYLLAACRIMQPASILDLGSGFSSYTLRTYARDAKVACAVTTVDDEPAWLERSREFLHAQGLDARGLATWRYLRGCDPGHANDFGPGIETSMSQRVIWPVYPRRMESKKSALDFVALILSSRNSVASSSSIG